MMPRLLKKAAIRLAGFDNTFLFLNEGLAANERPLAKEQEGRLSESLLRVSRLISNGNITVFRKLAWPFASFLNTFSKDWAYDEGKLQAFLDENLEPGPLSKGGQDYLFEAFRAFYKARYETEAKKKAEHVLHGNLLIGLHEQTRLQPQIEQSLSVPLEMFVYTSGKSGAKKRSLKRQSTMTRKIVSKAITQMMMGITLPSRQLKLGQDVIAPNGIASYPKELLLIENPRCLELVRLFETGQDTLSGSGAEKWDSLNDRMSFVVDFFRSHQQYRRLWEAPFLPEQVPVIESGHFPAGPL